MKEEKTEAPTEKKIKESRKEGRVPRTPELGGWASVLVVAFVLHQLVSWGTTHTRELMMRSTSIAVDADSEQALALLREGGIVALVGSVALGAAVLAVAVALAAAQGGIHLATKASKPKWSRMNPLEGAKRIFGPHALWEGAKTLLKSTVVALLVWRSVHELMPLVRGLVPLQVAIEIVAQEATRLLRDVAIAGLLAGAIDYAVQRRKMGKQNKMTLKEVRDEHKQSEGDPLVKHAMRSRQHAASRNRQMADVATADVVLVNPTHVAVALRYESEKGAPRVVAKGAGVVAARIRERAAEANVAMVEDVPLARALHTACEVGHEVPPELYAAVAQVLAFVVNRRSRGSSGGRHRSPRHELDLPEVPRAGRRRRTVETAA
ncbi:EscU/YscU/HrcU family type III secretion system export apparatus switch protein [Solicola sp. PLA-1-18]|uniref:EscU/YscU/HrcU family type III secretion system export apparatus switch protein n=1 Tax=Solicola sp. PLA-1-18 TaxID=3380532 RepID=UPI003B809688